MMVDKHVVKKRPEFMEKFTLFNHDNKNHIEVMKSWLRKLKEEGYLYLLQVNTKGNGKVEVGSIENNFCVTVATILLKEENEHAVCFDNLLKNEDSQYYIFEKRKYYDNNSGYKNSDATATLSVDEFNSWIELHHFTSARIRKIDYLLEL